MTLSFMERLATRFLLNVKLEELHGEAFESFFHDLMCMLYEDFLDVRTAGSLGDMGSDGLSLVNKVLYACYAPSSFDKYALRSKFWSDLEKALEKRGSQFDQFIFVTNDRRGMHPEVASLISQAADRHPSKRFGQFGYRRFLDQVTRLSKPQVEDLLGVPLPVQELTYSIVLEELRPLLDHLTRVRTQYNPSLPIPAVSSRKLSYNSFSEDVRDELRSYMYLSVDIDNYYTKGVDIFERDQVATGFRKEFERLSVEYEDDGDSIIWRLEQYILGNGSRPWREHRAAKAVIAYFFQTCDVFNDPPNDWVESREEKELL